MRKVSFLLCVFCMSLFFANAQRYPFNGLDMNMGNLSRLSDAKTRSISPENFTGAKGAGAQCELEDGSAKWAARDLGKGWKVNPYIRVAPGETFEIANIQGPGAIQHIWMTPTGKWRDTILRMYWDGQAAPSVECPVGDFFCCGWQEYQRLAGVPPGFHLGGVRQPGQRF